MISPASSNYDTGEFLGVLMIVVLTTGFLFTQATSKFREKLSTMSFASPAPPSPAVLPAASSITASNVFISAKSTVLIVDDDPVTRFQVSNLY
jgi:hypothetical protein